MMTIALFDSLHCFMKADFKMLFQAKFILLLLSQVSVFTAMYLNEFTSCVVF